jgi:hypothetical protein
MLETTSSPTSLMSYTYSEQANTHIMTFHKPTRQAYDEFLNIMTEIYKHVTAEDQIKVLVDYRQSGIPPIHYLIPKSLAWVRTLRIHPEARLAVVTRQDALSRILRSMSSTVRFGHLSTAIFEGDTGYNQALVWLQK